MGIYVKSGEGRCPYNSSYTEEMVLSRAKMNEYYELTKGQEDVTSETVLFALASVIANPLEVLLKNVPILKDVASSIIENYVSDWLTSNARTLDKILRTNSGKSLTVVCVVRCVNKGLNGHYWAIYKFKEAK